MKSTLIAAAILAVFSTSAMATNPTITGNAGVSGAISNSISTNASVYGVGTSNSGAGSNAYSTATATIAAKDGLVYSGSGYKQSIDTSIAGTTDTKVGGFAYNVSTGAGTGSATSSGYSDAGSNASVTGKLWDNKGQITLSGSSDTGHPTNVGFGPDVAMSAGTNQAVAATGVAGGTYDAKGFVYIDRNFTKGNIAGQIGDVKNATSFAATAAGTVTGLPAGVVTVSPTVLNAGSKGLVNASGNFITNSNQLGNFVGASAPTSTPAQ